MWASGDSEGLLERADRVVTVLEPPRVSWRLIKLAEARARLAAIEKRCFEELALLDAEQIIEEEEQKLA